MIRGAISNVLIIRLLWIVQTNFSLYLPDEALNNLSDACEYFHFLSEILISLNVYYKLLVGFDEYETANPFLKSISPNWIVRCIGMKTGLFSTRPGRFQIPLSHSNFFRSRPCLSSWRDHGEPRQSHDAKQRRWHSSRRDGNVPNVCGVCNRWKDKDAEIRNTAYALCTLDK